MNRTPENGIDPGNTRVAAWLIASQPLFAQLVAKCPITSWEFPQDAIVASIQLSTARHFAAQIPNAVQVQAYLSSLHLHDLTLACACAEGCAAAWDHFVSTFRGYLRSAAGAILHCPPESPAACELADSLFCDLYGVGEGTNRRSLFRYFHGRSSLKTWLRAVLAQRHVDAIRASRRFTELESSDGDATPSHSFAKKRSAIGTGAHTSFPDPHRSDLLTLFRRTLEEALGLLDPRDKERLRLYYAADQTLAEIGRRLGEHESSVSRNLERTRRELRQQVEQALRKGSSSRDSHSHTALSDAQITLCFQYAAEDAPIDLDKLLPERQTLARKPASKKP